MEMSEYRNIQGPDVSVYAKMISRFTLPDTIITKLDHYGLIKLTAKQIKNILWKHQGNIMVDNSEFRFIPIYQNCTRFQIEDLAKDYRSFKYYVSLRRLGDLAVAVIQPDYENHDKLRGRS